MDHQSRIYSGIPTPSIKHVPLIPFVYEHQYKKKSTYFFWKLFDYRKYQGAQDTVTYQATIET